MVSYCSFDLHFPSGQTVELTSWPQVCQGTVDRLVNLCRLGYSTCEVEMTVPTSQSSGELSGSMRVKHLAQCLRVLRIYK